MAAGMATERHGLRFRPRLNFNLVGRPSKWVSGKDVILHIIGMIGVDGALFTNLWSLWAKA